MSDVFYIVFELWYLDQRNEKFTPSIFTFFEFAGDFIFGFSTAFHDRKGILARIHGKQSDFT